MQVYFACIVILIQVNNFDCHRFFLHDGKYFEVGQGYSIIMQVCLSYDNGWIVVVVYDLMRSASDMTDIIHEGPGIKPSCFGWFWNIVDIYAQLLELEGSGYSWVSRCQTWSPHPVPKCFH